MCMLGYKRSECGCLCTHVYVQLLLVIMCVYLRGKKTVLVCCRMFDRLQKWLLNICCMFTINSISVLFCHICSVFNRWPFDCCRYSCLIHLIHLLLEQYRVIKNKTFCFFFFFFFFFVQHNGHLPDLQQSSHPGLSPEPLCGADSLGHLCLCWSYKACVWWQQWCLCVPEEHGPLDVPQRLPQQGESGTVFIKAGPLHNSGTVIFYNLAQLSRLGHFIILAQLLSRLGRFIILAKLSRLGGFIVLAQL